VTVVRLSLEYFTDEEYERVFIEFGGFRRQVAESIKKHTKQNGHVILDLLSGHGLLSVEVSKLFPESKIVATGLKSDVESFLQTKKKGEHPESIWRRLQYVQCNVIQLPLRSSSCDVVVNFLGLEDVLMTCGMTGLRALFNEIGRITRPGALAQITLVEYGNTPEEKLAEEIWKTIGLNAIFLSRDDYLMYLREQSFQLRDEYLLDLKKKMTKKQAREELEFACRDAPETFSQFSVRASSFDELWSKFGFQIEESGMAYWSKVRVMIFIKT
jgi:ubiquinone/menaquinone biosynthesis C-methylase UbiE